MVMRGPWVPLVAALVALSTMATTPAIPTVERLVLKVKTVKIDGQLASGVTDNGQSYIAAQPTTVPTAHGFLFEPSTGRFLSLELKRAQ